MKRFHLLIFFIFLTVVLHPWRSFVAQDDGVYAQMAIHAAKGDFSPHPLTLAAAIPQSLLGASFLKVLPFEPLSVLNTLTWVVFLFLCFLLWRLEQKKILIFSFFAFPLWIQYGVSFLSDVYAGLLLVLFLEALERRKSWVIWGGLIVLLGLQRQNILIFPLFTALGLFPKERRNSALLITFIFIATLIYVFLPHSILQSAFVYWRWHYFSINGFLQLFFQHVLSVGFFIFPFISLQNWTPKRFSIFLVVQFLVLTFLMLTSEPILSAGVLFTDHFPRWMQAAFLSFGVWGFEAILNPKKELKYAFLAFLILAAWSAFFGAIDIRYALLPSLVFAHYLLDVKQQKLLGESLWYCVPMMGLSLLVNLYNLNTTEQRWFLAKQLEDEGVPRANISAGFGHDLFYFGWECAERAFDKIKNSNLETPTTSELFNQHFFLPAPRLFEDEWRPAFFIKPSKFFGHDILNPKVQEAHPTKWRQEYSVVPFLSPSFNQVHVYEQGESQEAWCNTHSLE